MVKALQPSGIDLVEVFAQEFETQTADDPDAELFHRDLEVQFIARGETLEGTVYRGLEGLAQAWREWLAAWTSYRLDVDEFVDLVTRSSYSCGWRREPPGTTCSCTTPRARFGRSEQGRLPRSASISTAARRSTPWACRSKTFRAQFFRDRSRLRTERSPRRIGIAE